MTNAMWFVGSTQGSPLTEEEARATLEPVRQDSQTAEQKNSPDWNELDTDESPELVGLSPRLAGSDTHDIQKYPPALIETANANHNAITDNQVASSGTAAARELSGRQGHGTMQYALGIEPVIREGGSFGNDYFVSNPADIQDGAGAYMSPDATQDQWANVAAARNGATASRDAYQASLFQRFLGA